MYLLNHNAVLTELLHIFAQLNLYAQNTKLRHNDLPPSDKP